PVYRLVLTDSKNAAKSGRFLEILGNYDSRRGEQSVFKAEKISHWLSKGAQASDTVHNLLIDKKIITGKKINTLPKKTPIAKPHTETLQTQKNTETTPVAEEPASVEAEVAQDTSSLIQ